jgi:hypothetical protein
VTVRATTLNDPLAQRRKQKVERFDPQRQTYPGIRQRRNATGDNQGNRRSGKRQSATQHPGDSEERQAGDQALPEGLADAKTAEIDQSPREEIQDQRVPDPLRSIRQDERRHPQWRQKQKRQRRRQIDQDRRPCTRFGVSVRCRA